MQHEEAEQVALFQWAAYKTSQWVELAFLYHIPNGGLRTDLLLKKVVHPR